MDRDARIDQFGRAFVAGSGKPVFYYGLFG